MSDPSPQVPAPGKGGAAGGQDGSGSDSGTPPAQAPGAGGARRKRPPFRRLPSDRRREEIIAAAIEIFGRQAEPDVAIDDIAVAAGTSRSSVYRYFDTKQDLFGAAAREVGADLMERLTGVAEGPPSVQLSVRLGLFFDFLEQYAGGYSSLLGLGSAQAPESALAVARQVRDRIAVMTYRTLEVDEPSVVLEATVRSWIAAVEYSGTQWLQTRAPARAVLETLLSAQLATSLMAASAMDGLTGDRVGWLMRVEPAGSPFGMLVRGLAGSLDRRRLGDLARFLAHEDG